MHHIVPFAAAFRNGLLKRCFERMSVGKVEFYEVDARILQKFAVGGFAYGGPSFVAAPQRFFHDKSADKSAGSCDEYFFSHK